MTASRMGAKYIEEAHGRMDLVRLAAENKRHAATVREAQECVELFLKGAIRLAAISEEMTGDRGIALYGDETMEKGPQELFDESDARRAMENMEFVARICSKLLTLPEEPNGSEGPEGKEAP